MYTRGSVLGVVAVLSVLGAAGCGGDDTDSAGNAAAAVCDPNIHKGMLPGPCPQDQPQCPASMFTAVTQCMPNGRWNTSCSCVLTSSLQGGGAAGVGAGAMCGNGRIEAGEQCEPAAFMPMSCAQMMPGTTGNVSCNPPAAAAPCTFNLTMCMMGPGMQPMGGQGG